jgi:hypothetical protein
MKKLFLSFALAACSITAKAEVIDDPKEICKVAQSGKKGSWLDDSALQKCLLSIKNVESLTLEIENLKKQNESFSSEIDLMKPQIDGFSKILREKDSYTDSLKDYNAKIEQDLLRWYHNPWIVGTLGILVGTLTTTTVVIAVKK